MKQRRKWNNGQTGTWCPGNFFNGCHKSMFTYWNDLVERETVNIGKKMGNLKRMFLRR